MPRPRRIFASAALCLVLSAGIATAEIEPAPLTYVADRAGVIDPGMETRLIGLLQELERKTGARIIVLTVDTTDGQDIHQYALERADKWTFGPNRASASALLVVAVGDRNYRFEIGYDVEAVLTDGYVGQVGRDYLVPHFKAGRYGQGIFEATAVLAEKVAAEGGITLTGMPAIRRPVQLPGIVRFILGILPIVFIVALTLLSRGRHRSGLFWGVLLGSMMGGGRSGGFGGGGFGGFGGGGGGGFGGGGAGGSW